MYSSVSAVSRSPGSTFGMPGRIGRQRLGRDPADRRPRPARPPARRGTPRAGVISSGPHGGGGANVGRGVAARRAEPLDRVLRSAVDQPRGALVPPVSPIPNTATTTFSPASSRLMSSLLAHAAARPRSRVAPGAAHVDRQPQRVVAVHAGPPASRSSSTSRPGKLADRLPRAPRAPDRLVEQLAPVAPRRSCAPRRASRAAASSGSSTRPA